MMLFIRLCKPGIPTILEKQIKPNNYILLLSFFCFFFCAVRIKEMVSLKGNNIRPLANCNIPATLCSKTHAFLFKS